VRLSRFFVDRPIFAAVLSIIIFTAGMIAIPLLPVSEYPEVVPPQVQVRAFYPGANPKVLPALAALLLRPHGAPRDLLTRILDKLFGWFFRWFDRGFRRGGRGYAKVVGASVRRRSPAFAVYAVTIACAVFMSTKVPGGFVPTQDKMYLVGIVNLPAGASLDRTEAVVRDVTARALATAGRNCTRRSGRGDRLAAAILRGPHGPGLGASCRIPAAATDLSEISRKGSRITVRIVCEGDHAEPFYGLLLPTHRAVKFIEEHNLQTRNGQLSEDRVAIDVAGIIRQLQSVPVR
jgi:hypothetical protein